MSVLALELLSDLRSLFLLTSRALSASGAVGGAKSLVRFLSHHTGLPALIVAAVLLAVGYRLLKRTARFAFEVAGVALLLVLASELGWIRW